MESQPTHKGCVVNVRNKCHSFEPPGFGGCLLPQLTSPLLTDIAQYGFSSLNLLRHQLLLFKPYSVMLSKEDWS